MDRIQIYSHLPIWCQNFACYIEGKRIKATRYSNVFRKKLEEYEDRDKWSYDRLCDHRDRKLQTMINHCYNTVPYYRNMFKEYGINPGSIKKLDDLKVLPILTKEIVNSNPESFISNVVPRAKMITHHTSGTTGAGFIFQTTQEAQCEQWAVWWRYRKRLGIELDTLSGNFGTRFVVPANQIKPPFWRYNKPCHQVYFSAFHEKPEYLKYYIQEILDRNITWIHGYPSLLTELANEVINERNYEIKKLLKFVTIGAENLLDYQAEIMNKAFGVHVYQHYGMSEGVSNFSEYPDKRIFVDEDYAATEFIENDGITRIIGTNLTNYAMPLLRWDTKDTAEVVVSNNGRQVISIDGRIEDYVTLRSGKRIGKLDHVFKDAVHLKEVQIRQQKDYSIKVLYVPRDNEYQDDLVNAEKLFRQSFGEQVEMQFVEVQEIEKTKSGKLRFILSDIDNHN